MRALLIVLGVCPLATAPAPTQEALARLVREAESFGIRTAVAVRDLDARELVYRHRADQPLVPASNQKLVTVAAVLAGLGLDYEFETRFSLRGGWLEVLASGDPNWETGGDEEPVAVFARVARALLGRGVRRIRGVRLVPGAFTGPSRAAGWPRGQDDRAYCAPSGGHVLDRACYEIEIRAPKGARNAALQVVSPPAGVAVGGALELTRNRRDGSRYGFSWRGGELRASGHFLRGAGPRTVTGAVRDPAAVYRASLEQVLRGAGIESAADAAPADAKVYEHATGLRPAIVEILKSSSNFHAEQCFRVLGAERVGDGSFAGGRRAVRAEIDRLVGPLPDAVEIVDGSGLSRQDRLTAAFLTRLLAVVLDQPFSDVFLASLPQAGVDGTLEKRFVGSPLVGKVRAKTGTLNGVSALSGYVRADRGRMVAFSILMNDGPNRRGGRSARKLQEEIVAAIAQDVRR